MQVTIPLNPDKGWYKPDVSKVLPGDEIVVTTDITYAYLMNLHGTKEKPIKIIPKGTKQILFGTDGNYGIILDNCSHIIIDGSGLPNIKYGFRFGGVSKYISQSMGFNNSTNWEVRFCEITKGEAGIFANPSQGQTMYDISIHDNRIFDIRNPGGVTSEGIYLGNTSINTINFVPHFENLQIFNNILEDLGGDGIQVCNAQGYKIYGNKISKYGIQNLDDQRTGIIAGGNSWGVIEDNEIIDGTGTGIECFGTGTNTVQRNRLIRTATSANQPDAMYFRKNGIDGPQLVMNVNNNVIDGAKRNAIFNATVAPNGLPGLWENNTITNAAAKYVSWIGDTIRDQSPPPPPAKTVSKVITVYTDGTISVV